MEELDPYKVLGIDSIASLSEIKSAYKNLIKHYHPDKVATLPQEFRDLAHEKMVELNIAYEMLVYPDRFARTNRTKARKPSSPKMDGTIKRCPFCGAKNRIPSGTDINLVRCGKCKRSFKDIKFRSYKEKFDDSCKEKEKKKEPLYADYEEWKKKKGIKIEKASRKFLGVIDLGDPLVWVGILFCFFIFVVQFGTITGFFSPTSSITSISKVFVIIVVTGSTGFLMLYLLDQYLKLEALKKFGFGSEAKDSLSELICNNCGSVMRKTKQSKYTIPGVILLLVVIMIFLLVWLFIFRRIETLIVAMFIGVPVMIFLVFISATTKRLWICSNCGERITRTR
jgi:hypothetical protein